MKILLRWIYQAWLWAHSWFTRPRPFRAQHIEDIPDLIKNGLIYLVGEGASIWCVAFLCPCGCGALVQLNTLADVRPRWRVTEHSNKTISLDPSVRRQVGCRSHFFVRNGLIEWCGD